MEKTYAIQRHWGAVVLCQEFSDALKVFCADKGIKCYRSGCFERVHCSSYVSDEEEQEINQFLDSLEVYCQ